MAARGRAIRAGQGYFELFADDSKLVRGLQAAKKKMMGLGKTITSMGFDALKGGIGASLPFVLASQQFQTFEQAMARVGALTNAVGADFDKLTALAQKLGAETVFTATDAANAMSVFALAGYDVQKIMTAVGPTLDLAAAGQLDIAVAADIAAKLMAGMGISADQLGNAIDVMTKAMTTANTDLLQLGEAFQYVGPVAKTAGISFEEITAAIQLLSNAGIQGEMAGTSLRGILLALTSPSEQAAEELARLGIQVNDSGGNVRSLVEILADFEKALKGVGSGARLETLGKIFDARQAAGAAELIVQGAQALDTATKALQGSAGTANRISQALLDTQEGDFEILISALENLAIKVGKTYTDELRAAFRNVQTFLNLVSEWVKQNDTIVASLAFAAFGIVAFGATLVGVGLSMKALAFGLSAFIPLLGVMGSVISALASPLGLLAAGIVGVALAFTDWQAVMNTVVDYIFGVFAQIGPFIQGTINAMSKAIAEGNFGAAVGVLMAGVKVAFMEGTKGIRLVWQTTLLALELTWIDTWSNIKQFLISTIASMRQQFVAIEFAWKFAMKRMRGETYDLFAMMQDMQKAAKEIDAIGKVRDMSVEDVKQKARADSADAFAEFGIDNAGAQAELEKAKKDFEKARDDILFPKAPENKPGNKPPDIPEIPDVGQEIARSVQGGFNVSALSRSFGGAAIERTAKATEKTQANTAELIRIMQTAQFGLLVR